MSCRKLANLQIRYHFNRWPPSASSCPCSIEAETCCFRCSCCRCPCDALTTPVLLLLASWCKCLRFAIGLTSGRPSLSLKPFTQRGCQLDKTHVTNDTFCTSWIQSHGEVQSSREKELEKPGGISFLWRLGGFKFYKGWRCERLLSFGSMGESMAGCVLLTGCVLVCISGGYCFCAAERKLHAHAIDGGFGFSSAEPGSPGGYRARTGASELARVLLQCRVPVHLCGVLSSRGIKPEAVSFEPRHMMRD